MSASLPIWVMEPISEVKRTAVAEKLKLLRAPSSDTQAGDLAAVKRRLREVREYAASHLDELLNELVDVLPDRYPQLKIVTAATAREAVDYVSRVAAGNYVFINNSAVVRRELKPHLLAQGLRVVNSYKQEFDARQQGVADYWDLPRLLDRNLQYEFEVSKRTVGLPPGDDEVREYVALLGVNAVSAADGTVFFLQHFTNIYKDLQRARRVVLVIGLDKLAKDLEAAAFQTRCMGLFGAESMVLEVQPGASVKEPPVEPAELPPGLEGEGRELHVVILDNGRRDLLRSKFRELFLCIGCRACNQRCPVRHSFQVDWVWTPRNYLKQFLDGAIKSIDVCLHCESCRLACPLEIDIPHLMWEAKLDYVRKHGVSVSHMVLGRPELIAKAGSMAAPIANRGLKIKPLRMAMEMAVGVHREVRMPEFHRETFAAWFANRQKGGGR
ncbi:MAG: hypothetical protein ACPLPT_08470 [Moorellales bacterium]